jgi:hypothetical protein
MSVFDLLEAETKKELTKLLNDRVAKGWSLVSMHVTERTNGILRYTVLISRKADAAGSRPSARKL